MAENTTNSEVQVTVLLSTENLTISNAVKEVSEKIPNKDFLLNGLTKDSVGISVIFIVDNFVNDEHVRIIIKNSCSSVMV